MVKVKLDEVVWGSHDCIPNSALDSSTCCTNASLVYLSNNSLKNKLNQLQ